MKKFTYIIAALCVVAIGTAIFFGCEKENENINNTKNYHIKTHKSFDPSNPENYGILHNEIVNYINNNQPELLFSYNTIGKYDSLFDLIGGYLIDNEYFTEIEVSEAIYNVSQYIYSFGTESNGELNYFDFLDDTSFLRNELLNFGYHDDLIDILTIIHQASLDTNVTYETILSYINILEQATLENNNDAIFRDRFIQVFEFSNQYWDTLNCYSLPQNPRLIEMQNEINAARMQEYLTWQRRREIDGLMYCTSAAAIMQGIANSYEIRCR